MLESFYGKQDSSGVSDAFRSKGFSPEWRLSVGGDAEGEPVTLGSLPPFLRTLLVTDGTVTKSLEAYYWEPVAVEAVTNQVLEAQSPIAWLDVQAGEEVVARKVLLRGKGSQTLYASAFSIIRLSLIPEQLRDRLLSGKLGIGELMREYGLETYRDIQEFGRTRDMSRYGGPETDMPCVYRTYRIIFDHRPVILVSECFPVAVFQRAHD